MKANSRIQRIIIAGLIVFSFLGSQVVYSECVSKDVFSVNAGFVVRIEHMNSNDHGMGNNVIIEHTLLDGSKVYSLYAHLAEIKYTLSEGQFIDRGVFIGKMGASGYNDLCYWVKNGGGTHLHFEMKDEPITKNPSGSGSYWGYTPSNPEDFGYQDPNDYIGKLKAINTKTDARRIFWHPTRGRQNTNCLFAKDTCYVAGKFHTAIDYRSTNAVSFNEQFSDSGPNNWNEDSGIWSIYKDNDNYFFMTNGTIGKSSFATYLGTYRNFDCEARMKRKGSLTNANRLVIRSGEMINAGYFFNEYVFQYTQNGQYSVWELVKGESIMIKGWTYSSAVNQGNNWNTLRVVGNGSQFEYYINGIRVWSGTDSDLDSGFIGFGMYRDNTSTGNELLVDWARLSGGTTASLSIADPEMDTSASESNEEIGIKEYDLNLNDDIDDSQ